MATDVRGFADWNRRETPQINLSLMLRKVLCHLAFNYLQALQHFQIVNSNDDLTGHRVRPYSYTEVAKLRLSHCSLILDGTKRTTVITHLSISEKHQKHVQKHPAGSYMDSDKCGNINRFWFWCYSGGLWEFFFLFWSISQK